jgi:hypothetical protein
MRGGCGGCDVERQFVWMRGVRVLVLNFRDQCLTLGSFVERVMHDAVTKSLTVEN